MSSGSADKDATAPAAGLVIWRLMDGKPGHMNQSAGLAAALSRRTPVRQFDLNAPAAVSSLSSWLQRQFPPAQDLPAPDLILAAGHATHLPALAARRARGGRLVVLMRPSLPLRWFDLCLIPQHDEPPLCENVLLTRGALNTVQPGGPHDADLGLFLVGGPSAAYAWDDDAMLNQIRDVLDRQPGVRFRLTTSRRTPATLFPRLAALGDLDLVPWQDTKPGWVAQQLAAAGQVWVSEDSVSMIYEALTSGARVGLLAVPRIRTGRVALGVEQLAGAGQVVRLRDWLGGTPLPPPAASFDEAGRCADAILGRWFEDN